MADDKKIIFSMVGVSKAFQANKQVLKDIYLSLSLIHIFRFAFRDNQQLVTGVQLQRAIGNHELVSSFYQHHQHTFR